MQIPIAIEQRSYVFGRVVVLDGARDPSNNGKFSSRPAVLFGAVKSQAGYGRAFFLIKELPVSGFGHYAPVSKAEREGAGLDGISSAEQTKILAAGLASALAVTAPAASEAVVERAPHFAGGKPRSRVIPLDYHLEYAGRVYTTITVRRPTSLEVGRFFERMVELAAIDPAAELRFPMFVDEDGVPIPDVVLNALDGDDDESVNEAANDFLPGRLRRFRAALQPALLPPAGDNIELTSSI